MTEPHYTVPQAEVDEDIRHLKEKLARTTDEPGRQRLEKQIASLEDAIVIYRISRAAA